jgi:DNA-damage-inducible protein D
MTGPVLVPFDGAAFEQRAQPNGGVFWSARDFMVRLGYVSFPVFKNAINRAIGTCTTLGIPIGDNFVQAANVHGEPDYKLSRFACLLVAMNGDPRKPEVAAAQAYFATLAEATRLSFLSAQDVERVAVRDDISERERGLSSAAKRAGVDHYAFFQNEGYRGMYNMNLGALRDFKGLPDHRSPLDFMDKRELAGNLFRLTETEARLKGEGVIGQRPAERVAFAVGRKVRNMMIESDG